MITYVIAEVEILNEAEADRYRTSATASIDAVPRRAANPLD
jgi:hypothetical protein